jgi:hypothetical protein
VRAIYISIGIIALSGFAFGQAMIEHGAAAITGSTAGAGLGKSIGKVLNSVNQAAEQAAHPASTPSSVTKTVVRGVAPSDEIEHRASHRPGVNVAVASHSSTSEEAPEPSVVPEVIQVAAPRRPEIVPFRREALLDLKTGSTRDELIAKVGTPFFKVIIPDENHSLEIYRYRSEGQDAAVVNLVDGIVASVDVIAR